MDSALGTVHDGEGRRGHGREQGQRRDDGPSQLAIATAPTIRRFPPPLAMSQDSLTGQEAMNLIGELRGRLVTVLGIALQGSATDLGQGRGTRRSRTRQSSNSALITRDKVR
ncbi:MAG: hypothetical protein R3B96_08370 [Pirellulaceae bacterium]